MDFKEYIDLTQWQQDQSPNFTDGQAYWAKVANAVIELGYKPNVIGESIISIRVRTGGATPDKATEYVSSYSVKIDGVNVPLSLDTTKPNEPHTEFGGCHLGYLKGTWNAPDTVIHDFEFKTTRMYGGVDALYIIDQTANNAYAKGIEDGKAGMYTAEEVQKRVDAAFKEGKGQGVTEGKQKQLDFDNAYTFVLAP
jgi:hypothetical protein